MKYEGQMNDIFMRFPGGLEKAVTFSYDDGTIYDKKLVEIFDRYGMKGTFNLNAGRFKPENCEDENYKIMTEKEAIELFENSPHEVANHGFTHPFYDLLPNGMAAYELIKNREKLEKMLKKPIMGMAYPNGAVTAEGQFSDEMIELIKSCGIKYSRTTDKTSDFRLPKDWLRMPVTCHHNDPKITELAKKFAETKADRIPRLFFVWGHSIEFEQQNNWDAIERLCAYFSGFDDIWFATNMEIYNYAKAYENLQFSADGSFVFNPSGQTVYIERMWKQTIIKPFETVKVVV